MWLQSALSSLDACEGSYGYGPRRPCRASPGLAEGLQMHALHEEQLDEASPLKSLGWRDGLRSGRKLTTRDDWHSFEVRLLHPLEEGKSFDEAVFSPKSGDEGRCRSASPSLRGRFEAGAMAHAQGFDDEKFRGHAKIIARDVARVFAGHEAVDQLRLHMAAILRGYARRFPTLGYTQGMCFLAAVTCSKGPDAEQLFVDYMSAFQTL
ncbi:unnamed protein product [Effrenium voratum]|nr:unnamed protein product [Effrenium voratum]